jgi:hypothetical protein
VFYYLLQLLIKKINYPVFGLSLITACLFFSINFGYLDKVVASSYLNGSSEFIEWVLKSSRNKKTTVYFEKDFHYGKYLGPKLIDQLSRLNGELKGQIISDPVDIGIKSNEVLICPVSFKCSEVTGAELISFYDGKISWTQHSLTAYDPRPVKLNFEYEAYYFPQKIVLNQELSTNSSSLEGHFYESSFIDGWWKLEKDFVWSKNNADIRIKNIPECDQSSCFIWLSFFAFNATSTEPEQLSFKVISNAGVTYQMKMSALPGNQIVKLPLKFTKNKDVTISINVKNAASPLELGKNDDPRVLGIALESVKVAF